jgi:hypothetical protein
MTDQQQSHRDQRHHQRNHQDHQRSGNPEEQRREFLWRERVKLELQVQALIARTDGTIFSRLTRSNVTNKITVSDPSGLLVGLVKTSSNADQPPG